MGPGGRPVVSGLLLTRSHASDGLPLDGLPASAAAFSLRRLRSAYTGPAVRVRRSSDNAEADVGFTVLGDLDTTALLAHCGAGSGLVATWYDQSGNGRDVTQATAGSQPRIVNAGVVESLGGRPAVRNLTTGTWLETAASVTVANQSFANAVAQASQPSQVVNYAVITQVFTSSRVGFAIGDVASTASLGGGVYVGSWRQSNSGAPPPQVPFVASMVYGSGTTVFALDGAASAPVAAPAVDVTAPVRIGRRWDLNTPFAGLIGEAICGAVSLTTAQRQVLESNQGAYYGVVVS